RMDICDDPNSPFITALFELPGMKADQLSVRIEDGKLIVDGERTGPHLHGNGHAPSNAVSEPTTLYPVQEIKYGKFRRELALPSGVTAAHVRSTLAEGMLTVSWPRNP
ncbi:HSP20-like chaperone, partial [Cubamyces menziesii]